MPISSGKNFISADAASILGIKSGNDVRHVVRSSFNPALNQSGAVRAKSLLSLDDLIGHSTLIESFPNQDIKKENVERTHRFYTPVRIGNKLYAVRIVAQEMKGNDGLKPIDVDIYDVVVESNNPSPAPSVPPVAGRTTDPAREGSSTVTIREMLSGVKDAYGVLYDGQSFE